MNKKIFFLSMMLLGGSTVHALADAASVAASDNPQAAIAAELGGLTGQARVRALNNLVIALAQLPAPTPAAKAQVAAAVAAALTSYSAAGVTPPASIQTVAAAVEAVAAQATAATPGVTAAQAQADLEAAVSAAETDVGGDNTPGISGSPG